MSQSYPGRRSGPNSVPLIWEIASRELINTLKWDQQMSQDLSKLPTGKMPQEREFKGTFLLIRLLSLKLRADLSWSLGLSLAGRGGQDPEPLAYLCRRGVPYCLEVCAPLLFSSWVTTAISSCCALGGCVEHQWATERGCESQIVIRFSGLHSMSFPGSENWIFTV